jgi:hypothetical protein
MSTGRRLGVIGCGNIGRAVVANLIEDGHHVSVYDANQHFVANPLNRHNIGSGDNLRTNPDGSLDLYIQSAPPKDMESNWLPAPPGPFTLILRVYWPKQEVVDGRWNPPGIRKVA